MVTQNSFSFSRLVLLIKKQWFDNAKLYTLSLLALTGILSIVFICWAVFNGERQFDEEDTFVIFGLFLFSVGLIFASTTFNALSDKAKGTYWLTVPATHLEKLLCGIFYSVIVFLTVYVTLFLVIRQITFFSILLDPRNRIHFHRNIWEGVKIMALIFIPLQILFLLGSVYFERFSFIKTILAGVLLIFLYTIIFQFVTRQLFDHGSSMGMRGLTSFEIYGDGESKIYRLADWAETSIEELLKYIWAPILLVAAYFRLKEKEL